MPAYTDDVHPAVGADITRLIAQGHRHAVGAMIKLIDEVRLRGISPNESAQCTVRGKPLYARYANRICGVFTIDVALGELILLAVDLRSVAIGSASSRV